MAPSYKNSEAYQRYRTAGRPSANKLPVLQQNNDGRFMIMSGELYCRWRENGRLCVYEDIFSSESALHRHYDMAHEALVKDRTSGRNKTKQEMKLRRWYEDIMEGRRPTWLPRKPLDGSAAPPGVATSPPRRRGQHHDTSQFAPPSDSDSEEENEPVESSEEEEEEEEREIPEEDLHRLPKNDDGSLDLDAMHENAGYVFRTIRCPHCTANDDECPGPLPDPDCSV
ncbi:hypothetical protein LMH87_000711 [Akanthomyces muscarius]|uniref:Uncharacterized protein n=1 Tax=Akanthomyces muscarius TaxID=2231603 RepID=A0A9W8QA95_AKAMU|nr:hypothetical protein LMH87_012013 [Akanthomyces muscarius]XP_056055594.1 hypothetical protein LMH87_000711 [Akanthomyces muscarius]KAJ4151304.1 hypothetical protein LMH87_012013 [Akanthomyces muscarius]KAJ4155470.1 hypothetical protein LMH87_000711 [Akanthomyces muscarius]